MATRRKDICLSRKRYRETRRDTSVTVYTIHQESRYLIVQHVPSFGSSDEILKLFSIYGAIEEWRVLADYPHDEFEQVFFLKFKQITNARVAKRKMNNYNYLGQLLHVGYGQQFETIADTRAKLRNRLWEIEKRTGSYGAAAPTKQPHIAGKRRRT